VAYYAVPCFTLIHLRIDYEKDDDDDDDDDDGDRRRISMMVTTAPTT
jgi:hypothetical protein